MPKLVVIEGPNRGAVLKVLPDINRLGRDPENELCLPDDQVSRLHAEILFEEGDYVLVDQKSKNATYLNGVRVTNSRPLGPGDEIRVGKTTLLFVAEDHADLDGGWSKQTASSGGEPVQGAPNPVLFSGPVHYLVGESDGLLDVSEKVSRCAPLDTTVLITGESGTGKELVARALHRLSPRRVHPFIAINCASLDSALLESELFGHERGAFTGAVARKLGKMELVGQGTLFLDEIGELPAEAQAKLLRTIEQREFQRVGGNETLETRARFVAATHCDLPSLVDQGKFREDLFYRLRVVDIHIPPLRERTEDLGLLVEHFIEELREKIPTPVLGVSEAFMQQLAGYRFPGNVRELRNILERCLIFSERETLDVGDLSEEFRNKVGQAPRDSGKIQTLASTERALIEQALNETGWNKTQAAKLLDVDRATLYGKIKRFGLEQ